MTSLDQGTLLTRLKKLGMPSPPTSQQLSIIKCLRQLRHIHATKDVDSVSVFLCRFCTIPNRGS